MYGGQKNGKADDYRSSRRQLSALEGGHQKITDPGQRWIERSIRNESLRRDEIVVDGKARSEKAERRAIFGNYGIRNGRAMYREEKDRGRRRGNRLIYCYKINIMEGEYNFSPWPFRERDRALCNFF
jgi:hypothetical protein